MNSPISKRLFWLILLIGVVAVVVFVLQRPVPGGDSFTRLISKGNGYLEKGDATNSIAVYLEAVRLAPESIDVHLNLANAYMLAGENEKVIEECQKALAIDHNNAAAYYLMGCAYLHLNQAD